MATCGDPDVANGLTDRMTYFSLDTFVIAVLMLPLCSASDPDFA